MQDNKGTLPKLFASTFFLSAFTFGGGYVIVPLMKKKFADDLKWIDEAEVLDLIAIAQSAPGPIAVNASILLGYRIRGLAGALAAILGTALPPFIIISVISFFYASFRDSAVVGAVMKGMLVGVAAIITDVVYTMARNIIKEKNIISALIMAAAFTAKYFFNVNVIYIILFFGVFGAIRSAGGGKGGGIE